MFKELKICFWIIARIREQVFENVRSIKLLVLFESNIEWSLIFLDHSLMVAE